MASTAKVINGEFMVDGKGIEDNIIIRVPNDARVPRTPLTTKYLSTYFRERLKILGFTPKYVGYKALVEFCVQAFVLHITPYHSGKWNIPLKAVYTETIKAFKEIYGDNTPTYSQIERNIRFVIDRAYEHQRFNEDRLFNPDWREMFGMDKPTIKEFVYTLINESMKELL